MTANAYYTLKIQAQGRVVVPNSVRQELQVAEGDDLLLVRDDQGYRLTTRAALIEAATGYLARDDGRDLTAELLRDRQQETQEKGW